MTLLGAFERRRGCYLESMREQDDPSVDSQSWQAIARELANETDSERIALLAHQLNEALSQKKWDGIPQPIPGGLPRQHKKKPEDSDGRDGK